MTDDTTTKHPNFGPVKTPDEIGQIIRSFRKGKHLTLERVSGVSNVGTRFLSELERGKETAEIGKVLDVLNTLGLDVIIKPRGE